MTLRPALTLNLYLQGRNVLLVGTGHSADARAERLRDAGAILTHWTEEQWQETAELRSYKMVLAHSDDDAFNTAVAQVAHSQGVLAYAHDQPKISDFSMPALSKLGPLQIAISTQGAAPALASQIRKEFDRLLGESETLLRPLLDELHTLRGQLPRGTERMKALQELAGRLRLSGTFTLDDPS